MLKQMKRTSVAIKQRRQGLDHKIQDLFARVYVGGRTSMRNLGNTGTSATRSGEAREHA
jgi:hypothetical protein